MYTYLQYEVVVSFLIEGKFTAHWLLEWQDTPGLSWISQVHPCPLARGKDLLMLLEKTSRMEGPQVVNATCVANGIVYNKKGVWKCDKLQ